MDWFRRKSWSKADESEFFEKLGRARKSGRSQYLKIQGIELLETKDVSLLTAAESLLRQVLQDYPDDLLERAPTLHALAELEIMRGDRGQALRYLEQALETERQFPQVKTQAYLDYSEQVVKQRLLDRYAVVGSLLKERAEMLMFPIEKYKAYSILSIIASFQGNEELAHQYAELAEKYATAQVSGFRYHQSLGIVERRDDELDRMTRKKD